MKIVVTGGAGMIGSNLVARLVRDGHEVTVLDNFWRGSIANLEYTCGRDLPGAKVIIADLSTAGDWHQYFRQADCVYHLADIVAGIGFVFANEGFLFRKNLLINSLVTQAVAAYSVPRYIYVGTACSYPKELQTGVDARPLVEEDQFPASPESAYGWSKLMGELDARYLSTENGIETVVLSLHNVYGTPCDYKSPRSQVIPALVYRAILAARGDMTLSIWGDGSQGRAFVHVKDVIEGLVAALQRGHNAGSMQLGPNTCTRISDVAEVIRNLVDPKIEITYDLSKPKGDLGRCADYGKAKRILGWEPKMDLHQGIVDIIEFVRRAERS